MARSHSLSLDRRPVQRLLKFSITLVALVGTVLFIELFFGRVTGAEFSPGRFERRSFRFYQIPWLHVQISPVVRDDVSNDLERHLRQRKLIRAAAVNKRWDPVDVSASLTFHPGKGQALILCRYLDQRDHEQNLWWLEWTRENPSLAKPLWAAVQQAAELQAYFIVPELFERAAQAEDPAVFSAQLNRILAERYGDVAEDYLSLGRSTDAQRFQAVAQQRNSAASDPIVPAIVPSAVSPGEVSSPVEEYP